MNRITYIVMVLVVVVYLIVGAVVFHFLEHGNELKAKSEFAKVHAEFLENNTCITPAILGEYVMKVLEAQGKGVSLNRFIGRYSSSNGSEVTIDTDDMDTKWDIASSVLFCTTVISTIGYGNMSPKTDNGQLFCIFFAIIGIPMFAAVLVGTGERLQIPIKWLHRGRPWVKDNQSKDEQVKSIVFMSVGTFIIVFIPSIVFTVTQRWSYLESLYYTVITLTTIGFGDLVPGYFEKPAEGKMKKRHYFYRLFLGLWILFGLSWGALVLSEIGSLLQKKIVTAASQTQHRLSTLEGIVKKKAKQTKDKLVKKDKECYLTKNGKDLAEVEMCGVDKVSDKGSDEEELKYEPTDSDY
ncbi:hypothetical protein BsWGS_14862 [Bradybaena similaris]